MNASGKGHEYWQGVRDGFEIASEILGEAVDSLEPPYDLTAADLQGRLAREIETIAEHDQHAEGMRRALADVVESITDLDPESTPEDVVRTARRTISKGEQYAYVREQANE